MTDNTSAAVPGPDSGAEYDIEQIHGADDERVLDLFQNRAQLKKRFSNLQRQLDSHGDEIRSREAQIERAQADKRALEGALANTSTAYAAIAYYHLRGLWDSARLKLESFCEELTNQQRDRERKKQIMEFNQARERALADVSGKIATAKAEADHARTQLREMEEELASLSGLLNYFRRRHMTPQVEQQRAHYEQVRASIEALFDQRIKLESQPWPEATNLSVEGKRVVNVAVIAMAQHMYLHFSDNNLSALARATTLKRLEETDYGTQHDCEYLMHRVSEAILSMKNDRGFAGPLRERAKHLRTIASFRDETDTVPVAGSIGQIVPQVPQGEDGSALASIPHDVNVIVEDYWGLGQVLLR